MSLDNFESRRHELERDIASARTLLAELQRKLAATDDHFEKGRLEVNIEDVTNQLKDWEYALSEMTHGKE
jgi:uncharacterized coiled-coil protein SlyX